MAKTPITGSVAGLIPAGPVAAGDYTFTVTDPNLGLTLKADGILPGDALNLLRENYGADGWEPATDGRGQIQLHTNRRTATPVEIGVYTVEGELGGDRTLWTEVI